MSKFQVLVFKSDKEAWRFKQKHNLHKGFGWSIDVVNKDGTNEYHYLNDILINGDISDKVEK